MKALTSKTEPLHIISFLPLTFIIFFIAFMLLRFPETASQGITDGVDLSIGILIPSLYPFMILSTFITETGIFQKTPDFIDKLAEKLFALNGSCIYVIVLSLVGGLPMGCKMTSELYEKGKITANQGQRLMMFCYCCGPAFTISSVGMYILGSKSAGAILFASLVLSSLTVGILSRIFNNADSKKSYIKSDSQQQTLSVSLVKSVSQGSSAMLNICAWVILFSCINRLVEILPINDQLRIFSYSVLEVTNAVYALSGKMSLPIIAGVIGFGGLCGHCQVMPYLLKLKLKYKYFITSRIVSGALAVIYCEALMKIIPVSYQVFSIGTRPPRTDLTASSILSISMLFLAGLFLIGDSTIIKIKTKKHHP